jgi:hypothetical protein
MGSLYTSPVLSSKLACLSLCSPKAKLKATLRQLPVATAGSSKLRHREESAWQGPYVDTSGIDFHWYTIPSDKPPVSLSTLLTGEWA